MRAIFRDDDLTYSGVFPGDGNRRQPESFLTADGLVYRVTVFCIRFC
jgi:hypothetical protein